MCNNLIPAYDIFSQSLTSLCSDYASSLLRLPAPVPVVSQVSTKLPPVVRMSAGIGAGDSGMISTHVASTGGCRIGI